MSGSGDTGAVQDQADLERVLEQELAEAVLNLRHLERVSAPSTPEEASFVTSRTAALELAVRDALEGLRRLRETA